MFFPSSNALATLAISEKAAGSDAGTPRSGIGNEMNRMPCASATLDSSDKPSRPASSLSSSETMTWMPARRQPLTSSASQSSPLGLVAIANRPLHGPAIQNRSGIIMFLYYLSWQFIDVLAALKENNR